jgi:phosphomannomutase/phosphoglucomutase
MNHQIFREYDIRGKVDIDFSIDEIYRLTLSIGHYFSCFGQQVKTVVVGMDGRVHSPAIKNQVVLGLTMAGFDVVDIGVCTSPMLYFVNHTECVEAGIMITASHNPKEYNGLKFMVNENSLWGPAIKEIASLYNNKCFLIADNQGNVTSLDAKPLYIDWLFKHFSHLVGMDKTVVFDCGNAVACVVIPQLIERMQWKNIHCLCTTLDGNFPNHQPDPTFEENVIDLKQKMQKVNAVVGIGFDGDADRMGVVSPQYELVAGDKLLALFAWQMKDEDEVLSVVCDVKASNALRDFLLHQGDQLFLSPSGHAIIKDYMKKHNARLGGELSCHFFFSDRYFGYDDGIYAAMRLLEVLCMSDKTLDELLQMFPKKESSKEYRIKCDEDKKYIILQEVIDVLVENEDVNKIITLDGIRVETEYGWGLLRVSNTQPVLSLRFESNSICGLSQIKKIFINALEPFYDENQLYKIFQVND